MCSSSIPQTEIVHLRTEVPPVITRWFSRYKMSYSNNELEQIIIRMLELLVNTLKYYDDSI